MKNKQDNANQRGSALLLTLGVLSLALILAMAFAFSSRSSRLIAKVNADQIKARLLGESALERVIAAMKNAYENTGVSVIFYPPQETGLSSMQFTSSGGQAFIFSSGGSAPTGDETADLLKQIPYGSASEYQSYLPILKHITPSSPTFQKIRIDSDEDGDIDDDDEITGRLAFVIIEEANKLDINEMLTLRKTGGTFTDNRPFIPAITTNSHRYNDGMLAGLSLKYTNLSTQGDFLFDVTGTAYAPTVLDETNTLRQGLNLQELQINDYYFDKLPLGFPGTSSPSPAAGTDAAWLSYKHLWDIVWGPALVLPSDAAKYTFFSDEDIEAYWDDTNKCERQRFDITGYEWGSATGAEYVEYPVGSGKYIPNPTKSGWYHNGTLAGAQNLVDKLSYEGVLEANANREVFFDPSDPKRETLQPAPGISDTGFGIPYLKTLEVAIPNQGKQIAANMVDFCDEDSYATTDFNPVGAPTLAPIAYCGNEKVPYFNEVKIDIIGYRSTVDPSAPTLLYEPKLTIRPRIELVNIFDDAGNYPAGYCFVRVYGSYTITDTTPSGPHLFGVNEEGYIDIEAGNLGNINKLSYDDFVLPEVQLYPTMSNPYPDPRTTNASVSFSVQITQVVLFSSSSSPATASTLYDVGYIEKTHNFNNNVLIPVDTTGTEMDSPFVYEAIDPRCNHLSSCWETAEDEDGTFGGDNSNFEPNDIAAGSIDYEKDVTFVGTTKTFSTAFIPNRPFRNFWELGAIHRGEPFRTLDIAGDDAELLDQVKIGPLKRTRGKFNANSTNPAAFVELLKGINITDEYDATFSYATPAYTAPTSLDTTTSFSRGVFAKRIPASGLYTTEPANDREQEALIGRTANLLTTRMDKYTILVVGQAIKKLDDSVTSSNWAEIKKSVVNPAEYAEGYYSILATQRILAHVVRDAWRNEYKIVQMQLLED